MPESSFGHKGNSHPFFRQDLEPCERRTLPVDVAHDYRDDPCLSLCMPFQRLGHFILVAIIRVDEIGAHQHQDDFSALKVIIDPPLPITANFDLAIVPGLDYSLALQELQVGF